MTSEVHDKVETEISQRTYKIKLTGAAGASIDLISSKPSNSKESSPKRPKLECVVSVARIEPMKSIGFQLAPDVPIDTEKQKEKEKEAEKAKAKEKEKASNNEKTKEQKSDSASKESPSSILLSPPPKDKKFSLTLLPTLKSETKSPMKTMDERNLGRAITMKVALLNKDHLPTEPDELGGQSFDSNLGKGRRGTKLKACKTSIEKLYSSIPNQKITGIGRKRKFTFPVKWEARRLEGIHMTQRNPAFVNEKRIQGLMMIDELNILIDKVYQVRFTLQRGHKVFKNMLLFLTKN